MSYKRIAKNINNNDEKKGKENVIKEFIKFKQMSIYIL
jgi:hypothetical protein